VNNFYLNRPFWCQKHHFKSKKRYYFSHTALIVRRSPWATPVSGETRFNGAGKSLLSKKLGASQLSVSISVKRGEKIVKAEQLELVEG
jgi:hypothetical protein